MKCIIGKKIGMSQLFDENQQVQPVTVIEVGPCVVLEKKAIADGSHYNALVLGFNKKKDAKDEKALRSYKKIREFRNSDVELTNADDSSWLDAFEIGQKITAADLAVGDKVHVRGTTKGKGYQGGVKRHGFSGGPASHGHRHVLRSLGSIGSAFPQHIRKGKKMPGQMGAATRTAKNLEILWVDAEKNQIAVRGSVPGPKKSLLEIRTVQEG